ncbi:hypothetical protein QNI19_03235 [Cytophagaceae bacterium DM2B3-1]|uniref:PEGA domain-containing protein n=1 Tax=Xanthocytophaga flava TaxID=3048013 RepID=A0AAE3U7F6_9BACT|nr:hypothetical protein [Xanthocytophaga flavus]MDJ1482371.1 hypothetical protein [Xanthocytophaga flavus]MDJ1491930.1 hypothetical protein [Xanthocytophaga flavus]
MKRILLPAFACMLLASGCASIVSRTKYPVQIASAPDQASFTITNRKGLEVAVGTTPATVMLKSSGGYFKRAIYSIKFTKEGYEPRVVTLESDVNGWYFGNIVIGGALGFLIIDPATGAMYRINQKKVEGVLPQVTSSIKQESPSLRILSVDELPGEMKSQLIRIN